MTPNVPSRWPSYDGGSDGTRKISSPPERGLSWAHATDSSMKTNATVAASRARTRLFRQPDRVELGVQEMARRDGKAAHAGMVRHDPVPPQRRDDVRLVVEQALLEVPHQPTALVDVARASLTIIEVVERAVR